MEKREQRQRRARRTRAKIKQLGVSRLSVHRTPRHIYAQIINADGSLVIATASTITTELRKSLKSTGNKEAAAAVGKLIAERAIEKDIKGIVFDRNGYLYHGRIKAVSDGAREAGLKF